MIRLSLILVFLFSISSFANPSLSTPSSKDLYLSGIKAYQDGDFIGSREKFMAAANQSPHNETILYNWGLAEMQLENWGWALAVWRKALTISPNFNIAHRAIQFVQEKLPNNFSSYEPEGLDAYRANILTKINWHILLFSSLIFLIIGTMVWLKYMRLRLQALAAETALPKIPNLGIYLSILMIFNLGNVVIKTFDLFEHKATIVVKTSSLKTGPNTEDASLFELFEGQEVFYLEKYQDWLQIKVPGGVTGWVPENNLFLTSEKSI